MLTLEQEKVVQKEILDYYRFVGTPSADDLESWKSQSATWQLAWAAAIHRAATLEAALKNVLTFTQHVDAGESTMTCTMISGLPPSQRGLCNCGHDDAWANAKALVKETK